MQRDVALGADLAPSYLSRIENGKVQPTFPTVMRIVRFLGADLSEISGPVASPGSKRGPCPVTSRGKCLIDLIGVTDDPDHYTPTEIRLLRRFALWIKSAKPDRVRAIEVLLEDLSTKTGKT